MQWGAAAVKRKQGGEGPGWVVSVLTASRDSLSPAGRGLG
jgi:hypothetical protein